MIKINKEYNHIVLINNNIIIKLPKCKHDIDLLTVEYEIYSLIDHKSFNSFDTLLEYNDISMNTNIVMSLYGTLYQTTAQQLLIKPWSDNFNLKMLVGKYNKNIISLSQYRRQENMIIKIYQIYENIINIIEYCYNKWNFIHGDFKGNNILINTNNNDIKIIDFEFSLLFNDEQIIIKDQMINLYLKLDIDMIITKDFANFFDIYALCVDLVHNYSVNLILFKNKLEEIINNEQIIKSNNLLDFYIIYCNIYKNNKKTFINTEDRCLNLSFRSIVFNLLHIPKHQVLLVQNRINYILDIINKMIKLNYEKI